MLYFIYILFSLEVQGSKVLVIRLALCVRDSIGARSHKLNYTVNLRLEKMKSFLFPKLPPSFR